MPNHQPSSKELPADEAIIQQTQNWVKRVVVGCNFCPFAQREVQRGSIRYVVLRSDDLALCMDAVLAECERLDQEESIETTLLIFPGAFPSFKKDYLPFLEHAEDLLLANDYEGIYQVASFHPDYQFAGTRKDDPANYTNRSLYPMLHLLRESSLDRAFDHYPDPENIPQRNIEYAHKLGLEQMKILRDSCW